MLGGGGSGLLFHKYFHDKYEMTYLCAVLALLYMLLLDLMVKLAFLIYSCCHNPSISMATDGRLGVDIISEVDTGV